MVSDNQRCVFICMPSKMAWMQNPKHIPHKFAKQNYTQINSPHSFRMRENMDQNNSEYGLFSHNGTFKNSSSRPYASSLAIKSLWLRQWNIFDRSVIKTSNALFLYTASFHSSSIVSIQCCVLYLLRNSPWNLDKTQSKIAQRGIHIMRVNIFEIVDIRSMWPFFENWGISCKFKAIWKLCIFRDLLLFLSLLL